MIKRIITLLCICIGLIVILYKYSDRDKKTSNGFKRILSEKKAIVEGSLDLDNNVYSIFEVTSTFIRLYQYRKPYEQLKIPINLIRQNSIYLSDALSDKEKYGGLNSVTNVGKFMFILVGWTASAYQISSDQKKIGHSQLDTVPFNQSEAINSNLFLLTSRAQIDGITRRKLKMVDFHGKEKSSYIPEMQIDGNFCTDGQFRYDRDSKRLVYMFYYRGEFTCLDTNLNVLYQAKTIDTVKHANIHLKTVGRLTTQSTEPKIVNKRISVSNNKLYLNSALKADNESKTAFENNQVFDVYDLNNGQYSGSFYLPKFNKKILTEFKVYNQKIVALYQNTLVVFTIPNI